MRIRLQVLVVLTLSFNLAGQEVPRMPDFVMPPQPAQVEAPPPVDAAPPERELPVFTKRDVSANELQNGPMGEVNLAGTGTPWPANVAGVVLRSTLNPGLPDVMAQLGGSLGYFRILDHNNAQIFVVKADGSVGMGVWPPAHALHIHRNQNATTAILVNNDNAGTTSAAALRSLRFSQGATTMAQISSVGSGSTGYFGGPNALLLWNHMAAPTVIGTSDVERMRIHANGDVTIGSAVDYGRFGIYDSRDSGYGASLVKETTIEAASTQYDAGAASVTHQYVNAGVVADSWSVGTHSLGIRRGTGRSGHAVGVHAVAGIGDAVSDAGSVSQAIAVYAQVSKGAGTIDAGYGVYIQNVTATTAYGVYQASSDNRNYFAGRVGIGTANPRTDVLLHVAGGVHVDGNIAAKFQDLAEWVPATEDLLPGTVVVLNPSVANQVMPSGRPYDTSVAGVVSAQPGIILGEAGALKEQIATTGRVKVRVDATKSPIRIGDLLVSSDKPGTAMKSEPVEIGGIAIHRPGTLIGKALEPLDGGVGEILVLLSLQ